MYKIAKDLLFSRKKWFLLITCSFALMLAGLLSILLASETIKTNLKEVAYQNYGEHTGVLLDSDKNKEELMQEADAVGSFALSDTIETVEGKLLTVGWMDDEAIRLGRLHLQNGKFPKASNEVVIESSYLKLFERENKEEWKIGESKTLNFDNGAREVKLVGVLNDYSANWSVPIELIKGTNDFPNMLTASNEADHSNYLFKIDKGLDESLKQSDFLISSSGENSYLNSRLFYNGLNDYQTISKLAGIFQIVLFALSLFSLLTLISFYNVKTKNKLAVFKAIGATNHQLKSILRIQNFIMLGTGFLLSIPLAFLFLRLIITRTYNNGGIGSINWFYILGITGLLVLTTGFFLAVKIKYDIENMKKFSIYSLLKGKQAKAFLPSIQSDKFWVKQLRVQILANKKLSILNTATLTLTILVIVLSTYLQKETEGIWNTSIDYFVASQEIYSHDTVNHLTVLKQDGLTIQREDINRIKNLSSVNSVEKTPFMPDIHALVGENLMSPTIETMISSQGAMENKVQDKWVVPNVEYRIINKNEFETMFPNDSFEEFKGQVSLLLPHVSNSEQSLVGQDLSFIKMTRNEGETQTKEWSFPIYRIYEEESPQEDQRFVVLLDEETAFESGILNGYHELYVYLNENTTEEQKSEVEAVLSELVSTTPGSLYQKISDVKIESSNIAVFLGFLGDFSFAITITLAMISTTIMIFGKYKMQSFYWGTYMAIGMTKRKVLQFLCLELAVYLGAAITIGLGVYIGILLAMGHSFPLFYHLLDYLIVVLFIFLLLGLGAFAIRTLINKISIYSLLRQEE